MWGFCPGRPSVRLRERAFAVVSVRHRSLLVRQPPLGCVKRRTPSCQLLELVANLHCWLILQSTMSAHAAAWEQLPLGVQQRILLLTGHPSARRVSKAWRDTFDAANDT